MNLYKTKERIFCALFCFFILAAPSVKAQQASYTPQQMQAGIDRAESLLISGQKEEALEALLYMHPFANNTEEKTQIEFLIGMASAQKNDFKSAQWVFKKILKNQPALARVRLELALAYFEQGKYEKSDYHFRLVLGSKDLPPEVKQKILFFLAQIRYLRRWNFYLNLGLSPTTNINNASGAETECIEFSGILFCRELEKKRSSVGLSGYAGIENYLRLSKNWRIKQTLSGSIADYSGKEFDSYSLSYSAGPLYNFNRGYAGVYASGDRQWYGGKEFMYALGALGDFSYDLSARTSLSMYISYKDNTFDEYKNVNGHEIFIMPSLYWALSSKSYLLFKPSLNFFKTQQDYLDKDSVKYAIGFGTELPFGISVYMEPSYTFAKTGGQAWYGAVQKRKEEENFTFSLRLLQRQIDIFGFTPTLNYSFIDVSSNVQNTGYTKHVFELGATRRF